MSIVWRKFSDSIFDETSANVKILQSDYLIKGDLPVVDQGKKLISGYINDINVKCKVELPCIVFGDHTKIIKYIDFPFALGADGIKVLKPSTEYDTKYLYYYLKQVKLSGKKSYNRNYKYLKIVKIPFTLLSEQKLIAEILDKADSIRYKRKESIALLDEFMRSVFLDMFGDPVRNEKGWEVSKMDLIANQVTDGEHTTPIRQGSGIKLLSARNIKNGYLDFNADLDYISEGEFTRISKRCNPQLDDILMSCSGSVGRVAVVKVTEPFSLVRSVALIKIKKEIINSNYLGYYMRTKYFQDQIIKNSNASSQANIFTGQIRKLPVLIPPMLLQTQFAKIVEQVEATKAKMEESLKEMDNQFNTLLQGAFK